MIFHETPLPDAYLIEIEEIIDERGSFARMWCAREFEQKGLVHDVAQVNLSRNRRKGTVRGLHYQLPPHEEVKLVRCLRGAIYDVIIDLRADSPTYLKPFGVELSERNRLMLYVPAGFAHGFQTLEDDSEVFYQASEFYTPGAEQGIRFDDPAFDIHWPLPVSAISQKDESWPDYGGSIRESHA